jgi:hypothetical protein
MYGTDTYPEYDDYPGYGNAPGYDHGYGGQGGDWREPAGAYAPPRPRRQEPAKGKPAKPAKGKSSSKGKPAKSAKGKSSASKSKKSATPPRGQAAARAGAAAGEPSTRALRVGKPSSDESATRILNTGKPGKPRAGKRTSKREVTAVKVVAVASAFVVMAAIGTTAYYKLGPGRPNGNGVAGAFNAITNSKALAVLDEERQTIASMNSAVTVTSKVSKVSGVSPASVESAAEEAAQQAQQEETILAGELSPSQAMQVAQELMPDYGFSVSSQWTCLDDIWTRESDWEWNAENTSSGAYGIPQSLPADKMASVADDYMTDATTQIKWGLGYIEDTYGSPCAAWDFELDNGFY